MHKISFIGHRENTSVCIGEEYLPLLFLTWQCDCGHIYKEIFKTSITWCRRCRNSLNKHKDCKVQRPKKTRTERIWTHMLSRCRNPQNINFHRYGGRGIQVDPRWFSFKNFLEDMGEAPPGLTLDRINNDGNYEPSNCRWATPQEQGQNTSRNVHLTIGGQTKCLAEWGRLANMDPRKFKRQYNNGVDFSYLCSQGDSSGSDQDG